MEGKTLSDLCPARFLHKKMSGLLKFLPKVHSFARLSDFEMVGTSMFSHADGESIVAVDHFSIIFCDET